MSEFNPDPKPATWQNDAQMLGVRRSCGLAKGRTRTCHPLRKGAKWAPKSRLPARIVGRCEWIGILEKQHLCLGISLASSIGGCYNLLKGRCDDLSNGTRCWCNICPCAASCLLCRVKGFRPCRVLLPLIGRMKSISRVSSCSEVVQLTPWPAIISGAA